MPASPSSQEKINVNRSASISIPAEENYYAIGSSDWERIKRKIKSCGIRPPSFQVWYSILFSIGGSALLSVVQIWNTPNLSSWIVPTNLTAGLLLTGFAIVLVVADKKIIRYQDQQIDDILTDMNEVSKQFSRENGATQRQTSTST